MYVDCGTYDAFGIRIPYIRRARALAPVPRYIAIAQGTVFAVTLFMFERPAVYAEELLAAGKPPENALATEGICFNNAWPFF
jgi:hypothetical protein